MIKNLCRSIISRWVDEAKYVVQAHLFLMLTVRVKYAERQKSQAKTPVPDLFGLELARLRSTIAVL